jgi:hypothetical protein
MNPNLRIRVTQIAGLLLLAAWWMTSVQPASARPLPPGDPAAIGLTTSGSTPTPLPAAAIIVHDHPSVWAYLLAAAIAVVVTLVAVWAARAVRLASSRRPAKQLRSA